MLLSREEVNARSWEMSVQFQSSDCCHHGLSTSSSPVVVLLARICACSECVKPKLSPGNNKSSSVLQANITFYCLSSPLSNSGLLFHYQIISYFLLISRKMNRPAKLSGSLASGKAPHCLDFWMLPVQLWLF